MSNSKSTIADRLADAQKAINSALVDPEIKALLVAYGYNESKLTEGSQLADAVEAAILARTNALGAQTAASRAFADAQADAFKAYQTFSKVAWASTAPCRAAPASSRRPPSNSSTATRWLRWPNTATTKPA